MQYTLSSAQHVICGNRGAVRVLDQQGYRGGVSLLPAYGADTVVFKPRRMDMSEKSKEVIVSYFGRLVPEKGVVHLLKAFSVLLSRLKNRIRVITWII